jgi:hypothetical protein
VLRDVGVVRGKLGFLLERKSDLSSATGMPHPSAASFRVRDRPAELTECFRGATAFGAEQPLARARSKDRMP